MPDGAEIVRYDAGERRLLRAHDDIEAVLGRDEVFRHGREVNPDARARLHEFGCQRRENEAGIATRRLDAQRTEWSGLDVSSLGDIFVQLAEHLEALLKQPLAGVGQDQAMR